MSQAISISEKIFKRWLEKLSKEKNIPKILLDNIQILHQQGKLSDLKALDGLLKKAEGTSNDKD